ncbi:hypothetical protein COCNU_scaffold001368G000010 [Cocos nucifera]|nr:hypothetical protein [Cocos nucifera]
MRATEAEHLTGEKMMENESLHSALQKEFVSIRLKTALPLEEERRQEAEGRVAGLEAQMLKSISETVARAMEDFKASPKMKDLNIAFGQQAFIKDFELYKGRVARRFPKLDLRFSEEEDDVEAGPFDVAVNPSSVELASGLSEPATEAPEPVQKFEAVKSARASSATIPPEVEILE